MSEQIERLRNGLNNLRQQYDAVCRIFGVLQEERIALEDMLIDTYNAIRELAIEYSGCKHDLSKKDMLTQMKEYLTIKESVDKYLKQDLLVRYNEARNLSIELKSIIDYKNQELEIE